MASFNSLVASPPGYWLIQCNAEAVTGVGFYRSRPDVKLNANAVALLAERQMSEYFEGQRRTFDLPVSFGSKGSFFLDVWSAVARIPYGQYQSYSDVAQAVGHPDAARAVGWANGKNPIPVIIPCHRVIGKDRSLTGYAYGLQLKRWLLELEGALAVQSSLF